jgi:hypothetical protein
MVLNISEGECRDLILALEDEGQGNASLHTVLEKLKKAKERHDKRQKMQTELSPEA